MLFKGNITAPDGGFPLPRLPHVTWLRAFEAAARSSSFSAAASELGLTAAAVSQQIKLLEQHLGVRLLKRLPRGVALTDTGHAYAQPIRRSFADMQSATEGLFGATRKQTVRIHASISYAALVLAPQISAFRAAHPEIDVRLTTAVWTDPIDDDVTDLEIRFGHGDWSDLQVHHLGHRFAHVVCHPDFAASFGKALSFGTLAAHAVQIIGSESDWAQMSGHFGLEHPAVFGGTKADSSLIALQIVAGGTGAALVAECFTGRYIEQGVLTSPLDYRFPLPRSFFLVVNETAQKRSEVGQVRDWLLAQHREETFGAA